MATPEKEIILGRGIDRIVDDDADARRKKNEEKGKERDAGTGGAKMYHTNGAYNWTKSETYQVPFEIDPPRVDRRRENGDVTTGPKGVFPEGSALDDVLKTTLRDDLREMGIKPRNPTGYGTECAWCFVNAAESHAMACEHVAFCRECLPRYQATAYASVCPLYECLQRNATFELWNAETVRGGAVSAFLMDIVDDNDAVDEKREEIPWPVIDIVQDEDYAFNSDSEDVF
jgi:hypothetical protein